MKNLEFKKKVNHYLESVFNNITIIPEANTLYNNIKLSEFKTHNEDGNVFRHNDDSFYAVAVFNAMPRQSVDKIKEFIRSENFTIDELKSFVEQEKLTKYINGNTAAYVEWKNGDVGNGLMIFDMNKGIFKIDGFSNHSAIDRNRPVRERPLLTANDEMINNSFDDYEKRTFNNEFYNDSLDMDQQSQEFWDNL